MARKISPSRAKFSREKASERPNTGQGAVRLTRSATVPREASRLFKITNELGLHARAAAQFVKIASRFVSEIMVSKVCKDSREVNGKSIMGILMLAAAKGSQIKLTAIGSDSNEAIDALAGLIENKFGEA